MMAENDAGRTDVPSDPGILHAQHILEEEGQLRKGDILLQLLQGGQLHGAAHDGIKLGGVALDGVTAVHAHGEGPVLLRVAKAGEISSRSA